ncbi:N-alpha-acetyltransferase 40 like protein [Babesia gibsoni]|uniref:N-alpha-acetyltransferase 40 n=1 Tax=Babesia gibsoni TaxID=33632 RepID=A0AAD8UVJ0_BABGI|nr:N-alpha-acetyltransferase 40 like protein [Babesia gibsoni]
MGSKRRRSETLLQWKPDLQAGEAARDVCAALAGESSDYTPVIDQEILSLMSTSAFTPSYYTGEEAPKEVIDSILQLTKNNMERLYNQSSFLGGWSDKRKYREIKYKKTHILLLQDQDDQIVGFISYRFVVIDEYQEPTEVCYIYEVQVNEKNRSKGIGRLLIYAVKIIARLAKAKKLMCTVLKLNKRAIEFYRYKNGFIDDESDPDVVDYESRHENVYNILKLEL